MDIAVDVAVIIVCLAVAFLCVYLVVAIRRSKETIERLETSLESVDKALVELNERMAPVLEDARFIAAKLRVISSNVSDDFGAMKGAVQAVGDIIRDIQSVEKKVMRSIDNPVATAVNYSFAILQGVRAFIDRLREK